MDNFSCKSVTIEDVNKLTEISIRAFHSDFKVGAPNKTGGPPGYDSPEFHNKMLRISHAFYTTFSIFLKNPEILQY